MINDTGTISDASTSTPIDFTIEGYADSGFDPIDSPLKSEAGITPGTYNGGASGGGDGFLFPDATLTFTDLAVNTTPEPSTIALMFGGLGLLALMVRCGARA